MCWAENRVQKSFAQIRLEVQGKNDFENIEKIQIYLFLVPPTIDATEEINNAVVGQSVRLSCRATGVPNPEIIWQGVFNLTGSAIVDNFGNLYIDRIE